MEDHTTTDSTLGILAELRKDFPRTGAVLQAYLYRTEGDCRDLATRARGCGCARAPTRSPSRRPGRTRPTSTGRYVRCLKVLMAGAGYPMVATHDPRLVEIAGALAVRHDREKG